jgi:alcohol dehydrogenase class IV
VMIPFNLSSTPALYFGAGKRAVLPSVVKPFGKNVILVTGANSFDHSEKCSGIVELLEASGIVLHRCKISGEPTPGMIDEVVNQYKNYDMDAVLAIGGGSVLDAGKAISAMVPVGDPVSLYLEGVGTREHAGKKLPFIAVPTTAGTGSEATKNAVLSEVGVNGFKRSLRHNNFVPDAAIIDPELTLTCPPSITASSGMDAFTQLLESFLSTAANPATDVIAFEGLKLVSRSLLENFRNGQNVSARADMSLAAFLSGISLANAGLGTVHGFASSIGGAFDISHGVICSGIMGPANKVTVAKLRRNNEAAFLMKYAKVGQLFLDESERSNEYYIDSLLNTIDFYTETMCIPRLSKYGVTTDYIPGIVEKTNNKNNPANLTPEELVLVLQEAI